jgi:hypothetical protein
MVTVGQQFGEWAVLSVFKRRKWTYCAVVCRCSPFEESREVRADSLTSERSTNCGCRRKVKLAAVNASQDASELHPAAVHPKIDRTDPFA